MIEKAAPWEITPERDTARAQDALARLEALALDRGLAASTLVTAVRIMQQQLAIVKREA